MKAVNLIPTEVRRGGAGGSGPLAPTYFVLGLLVAVLALLTVYVLTNNTISDRKAKLSSLNSEVAQAQAQAARLVNYARFEKLAQTRAATVRQIAASRFNWHAALSDLSKVVPADTSLQSLNATVAPGVSSGGSATPGGGSSLRGDITAPAFELSGCTANQDDVARLMSRLRLINGVTRVTLGSSQKADAGQAGAGVAAPGAGSSQGCGANAPTFDIVVFFNPIPGAAALSGAPGAAAPTSSGTPAGAASSASSSKSSGSSTQSSGSSTTSSGGSK